MKKSKILAWILAASLILPGISVEAKSVKKPKLNKTKLTLKVGGKKQLSIKNRKKLKIKKVTYSSSKKKVAKVTKKGKVKALRKGTAKIICKVVMKNGKKYRLKCKVTVQNKKKKADETVNKTSVPEKTISPEKPEAPSVTDQPQDPPKPTEAGEPGENPEPTGGDAQESSGPTEEGDAGESPAPTGTGEAQASPAPTGAGDSQGSPAPTGTGDLQGTDTPSKAPSNTDVPASEKPTGTSSPEPTSAAELQFTLPPAATFTPSPVDVPRVSHLSKNGITTLDTGVMRDSIDAYDIVWDMGLGTNLGNTMESCGTWIDSSSVTNYEKAWGAPVTTQKMLTEMKAAGFSSIRIPVAWSNMMSTDGSYTINEKYFDRVETIMNYALNEDMYVIINIHYDSGWWARFGSKDATERDEAMKKFKSMWLQIANRFEEYSDYLIFESANEELGERLNATYDYAGSGYYTNEKDLYQLTNTINQTFVNIVRSTGGNNARRFLLIAGYNTDIGKTCDSRYQMPKDNIDGHLMVSIHYYSPSTYCIADNPGNSWGYMASWGTSSDIEALKKELGKMRTSFVDKGYPVIIGEYGVTDIKIDENTRQRKEGRDLFFKTVCEYATANNMCPVLWDCSQVFDRSTCTMTNETEKANYLSLSQKIKETPVVKPSAAK